LAEEERTMKHHRSMIALVDEYLAARRALGFALRIEGGQLHAFARYADARRHRGPLTVPVAIAWARSVSPSSPLTWARRLEVVRSFACYRAAFDPATEVPPPGLLGRAHRRLAPYIYAPREIAALVAAAARLAPRDGLRPRTFATLSGLLACTGMRVSESLGLTRDDVDLAAGVLRITVTKFRKTRLVPLHPSARYALQGYATTRDRRTGAVRTDAFFVLDDGTAVTYSRTRTAFAAIRRSLGWIRTARRGRAPRMQDLRHSFACHRLLRRHREGADVHAVLPALSTYLGHAKVSDTYWYLTGIPDLMALAAQRFDRFAHVPTGGAV